ncbi:MAG TPA: aldehyde dehydrogenase family protein [Pyrinomonadaceae bacterium]
MSVQTLDRREAAAGEIVSRDPANGEELGRTTAATAEDVQAAVERARAAQPDWAARSFRERGAAVMRARRIVLDEMEEIARLISRESGKPLAEALSMELSPTLDLMQHFARRTQKLLRPQKIDIGQYGLLGRTSQIIYRPLGVVGIISPWNFPWAIPLGEVVMALMAGNAVVLKPSELTTLVGLKIGEIFRRAALPEGLLSVVAGDGRAGAALVEANVDKIMFTGSVATGRRVAEAAARRLVPVVLELGGKDPMIVLDDANVMVAAGAAVWGAFCNSGQACASVERCYVQESIAPRFIEEVVKQTRALRQAAGTESDTDIGAMSSERQLSIVAAHVEEALAQGARALTGGRRAPELDGPFYEPTVLADVTHEMTVMREETFGPVLPLMTFRTEDEAVRLANDSQFGLTASVWTKDIRRGRRLAERIEAGTVMVNEVLYTHGVAQTPWGGMKQSGLGRTHGRLGLLELVAPQHVHINRVSAVRDLWWFRYTPQTVNLFRGFARRFASGSALQSSRLLPQIMRRLFERRDEK